MTMIRLYILLNAAAASAFSRAASFLSSSEMSCKLNFSTDGDGGTVGEGVVAGELSGGVDELDEELLMRISRRWVRRQRGR